MLKPAILEHIYLNNMINIEDVVISKTKFGQIAYYKNDLAFVQEAIKNKVFEQDLIISFLLDIIKKSSIILDIGAHAGSHTLVYKNLNKDLKIFAFEPQSKMFDLLQFNVNINNLDNVFLYNCGIANIEKNFYMSDFISDGPNINLPISYGGNAYKNLGGMQIGYGGEEIALKTLDSFNFPGCDFIKIDVEGAEPLVLSGSIKTIKKFRPVILFENNHKTVSEKILNEFGVSKSSFEILNELDYNIFLLDNNGNYLAKPK